LYDSVGSVSAYNLNNPKKAQRDIRFFNSDKKLINLVKKTLRKLDIKEVKVYSRVHSGFGSKKTQYTLTIFGQENLSIFYKQIGFSIQRKQDKLKSCLESYSNYIICALCGIKVKRKGSTQKYCEICSKEKKREYKKKWREKNPNYNKEYIKKYFMNPKNKEKRREWEREWSKEYRKRDYVKKKKREAHRKWYRKKHNVPKSKWRVIDI